MIPFSTATADPVFRIGGYLFEAQAGKLKLEGEGDALFSGSSPRATAYGKRGFRRSI